MKSLHLSLLLGLATVPATAAAAGRPAAAPAPAPVTRPAADAQRLTLADGRVVVIKGDRLYLVDGKNEAMGPDGDYPLPASAAKGRADSMGPDGNRPDPSADSLGPDGNRPVGASIQVRSGKIVNPGVLKGFNPQPEPPARTPAKP